MKTCRRHVLSFLLFLTTCHKKNFTTFESVELRDLSLSIQAKAEKSGCVFSMDSVQYVTSLSIDRDVIAQCSKTATIFGNTMNYDNWLVVNDYWWPHLSPCMKELQMTHELAHCSIGVHVHESYGLMYAFIHPAMDDTLCKAFIDDFWSNRKCNAQGVPTNEGFIPFQEGGDYEE